MQDWHGWAAYNLKNGSVFQFAGVGGWEASSRDFVAQYGEVMAWVDEHNSSTAEYHDTRHLLGVGWLTYVLCRHEAPTFEDPNVESVVVAGLLHDFAYLGAALDSENIDYTLSALESRGFWERFPNYDRSYVEGFIRDTLWVGPEHVTEQFGLTAVIRDADQLYATVFCDDDLSLRLFKELGKKFGIHTFSGWLNRNQSYVLNLHKLLHTTTARSVWKTYVNVNVLQQTRLLATLAQPIDSTLLGRLSLSGKLRGPALSAAVTEFNERLPSARCLLSSLPSAHHVGSGIIDYTKVIATHLKIVPAGHDAWLVYGVAQPGFETLPDGALVLAYRENEDGVVLHCVYRTVEPAGDVYVKYIQTH